ncbi:MAG: NAD-dependent epimerase/dehydratase family protein [Methanoregula sp.]
MIKTILLTGATGFLGSHLLEALIQHDYRVVILKRSFSNTWRIDHLIQEVKWYDIDKVPLEKAFEEQKIDAVIHTAVNYGRANERVSDIVDNNLIFGLRVLESAASAQTRFFFNTDTMHDKYLSDYTMAKKQFSEWLKIFGETGKIHAINFRIEHMYGPKDDNKKFGTWLLEQMLSNKDEIRLTAGEQQRDFIFITDIVNAYLLCLQQADKFQKFNEYDIGTGNPITVKEFVLKLKDTVERIQNKPVSSELRFGSVPYRAGEKMGVAEDLSQIFALGWRPATNLEDGLSAMVSEYIDRCRR